MEAKAAFVWAESRVELHTVSAVDSDTQLASCRIQWWTMPPVLYLIAVVFPYYAELNDTLGDRDNLERGLVLRVFFKEGAVLERRGQLCALR